MFFVAKDNNNRMGLGFQGGMCVLHLARGDQGEEEGLCAEKSEANVPLAGGHYYFEMYLPLYVPTCWR